MCVTTQGRILEISGNIAVVEIRGKASEVANVRIDLLGVEVGDSVYCTSGMAVEKVE